MIAMVSAFQKTIKNIHANVCSYFKSTNIYGIVSMCHIHRWLSHGPDLKELSATILFVCHFRIYEMLTHTVTTKIRSVCLHYLLNSQNYHQ